MPETAQIAISLQGNPPEIRISSSSVTAEAWYRIALLLTEQGPPPDSADIIVRPITFLRQRIALQGLLRQYRIGLTAEPGVQRMLVRSRDDQRALTAALSGHAGPASSLGESSAADLDGGRSIKRTLRPFQERDLNRLSRLAHGANFSVPGAGKTTVTFVLHSRARAAGLANRLLVIAPISAFRAWEDDSSAIFDPPLRIARWRGGPVPDTDVVLVNYQRLPTAVDILTVWMLNNPTHLVVDEAHRAKRGAMGEWGRAILALAPFAVRRDVLTGTPAPNQPRDLAAILDIIWPGGSASSILPAQALRPDPPQMVMRDINRAIAPLYTRTTKAELDLPDPHIQLDRVPMGLLQQQIYDAMLNRYAGMFDLDRRDSAMFAQMGEVMMYLLQAASSPRLLANNANSARAYRYPPLSIPTGSRLARLVDSYADHEIPSKIARACRLVHANATMERKTLVWTNFPDNILDLEQQLAALNPAIIFGAIPSNEESELGVRTRERELDRFRNDPDCRVLLANPAAMSEGVSLHQCCHDAIYVDRTFNAGQYLQSLDRIHRLGLPPNTETRITVLTSEGTIDERVNTRVEDKARRLALMLDDPLLVQMALPDDEDPGDVIDDSADLVEILGHLAEGRPGRGGEF